VARFNGLLFLKKLAFENQDPCPECNQTNRSGAVWLLPSNFAMLLQDIKYQGPIVGMLFTRPWKEWLEKQLASNVKIPQPTTPPVEKCSVCNGTGTLKTAKSEFIEELILLYLEKSKGEKR
jgi:hypothetical protein